MQAFMTLDAIRHDWTRAEVQDLYDLPLLDLVFRAQTVHRQFNDPGDIQRASLLSIKTGGCSEDCHYCPQSAHHQAGTSAKQKMLDVAPVLEAARAARDAGAQRFCMGAAWRRVKDGPAFDQVIEMVRGVRELGMEACVTLGMLKPHQAKRLAEAGLTAYNHNLDTSLEFYGEIVTTHTYQDRLETIALVRDAGIGVCSGGIIGMGESNVDRCGLLQTLATQTPHPDSVPINALVAVAGTPLEDQPPVDPLDVVRMCAVARILMPKARVRLSAGRSSLSREAQALAFLAGANSLFYGDTLLTTANSAVDTDVALLAALGIAVPCWQMA